MKNPLTLGGIGPRLGLMCLPYIVLSLAVMIKDPEFLNLKFLDFSWVKILACVWFGAGVIFWASSAVSFLRHFKEGKLITRGPFGLCRNPIYSSIIVFIFPSLGLYFHSGLLLSVSLVLYIGFKISIHGEGHPLRKAFGEEYERYEKSVNEIVPFPRHLFRKKPSES